MENKKKIIEVGRECVRIAGRFANKVGKIAKVLDDTFVEVEYKTTKGAKIKKTNIAHIIILTTKAKQEKQQSEKENKKEKTKEKPEKKTKKK